MSVNRRIAALLAIAIAFVVGYLPLSGNLGSPDVTGTGAPGVASSSAGEPSSTVGTSGSASDGASSVSEDGTYTSKDEVALYIHTFGHLPSNFITKTKAKEAGWVSSEGNLDKVCPGKSIGGSKFYNDDGALPDARGRTWKECDVNYHGGFRGQERIVFSSDGLVYYTPDHYQSFERLY
ncbi:MAG: hypothetical protein J6D54_00760 [Olsenella sp.]|nr:hypothetical protein [Olsenella sp.]